MKIILVFVLFSFLLSCKEKESISVNLKEIDNLIYNKKYSDAEKYINALLFIKKDEVKKDKIKTLKYKLSKLYYIHLDREKDAYNGFKEIIDTQEDITDIEILEYLVDISKDIKPKEEIKWLRKIDKLNIQHKEYLYRYINILQKNENLKKELEVILNKYKNDIYVKILKIDQMRQKGNKYAIIQLDKYLKITKNNEDYDQLLFKKISILEDNNEVNYKSLIKELSKFKTDFYIDIISQKKRYYTNKINLGKK